MSRPEDQEAIIKKWVEFFESSDSQFHLKDVIVCLTNVGLLQLQLEQELLEASTGNSQLSRLDNILEEMYRNVGDILQFGNFRLALDKRDTSINTVLLTTQIIELTLKDKVVTRKLQCLVNAVKLTVAGSLEASKKFRNSNFLYFVQILEETFVRCPWRTERDDEPPPAFIHECPQVSNTLAYSLVDSCEIKRSISTLLRLGDLIEKAVSEIGAVPEAEDTTNQPALLSDIWAKDLIMKNIFKCLPAQDCLRLRTVNQRFNYFAVQTLHRYYSDSIKLQFEYDPETKEFLCPKLIRGIYHKLKLADLTNIMKPYSKFPCVNFSFDKGTIASPDIQGFLDNNGKQIKILHLHLYCEPEYCTTFDPAMPPVTQFLTLIKRQAPHLEALSLDGFPQRWVYPWHKPQSYITEFFPQSSSLSESESVVQFKNLKTFRIVSKPPNKLVEDFLQIVGQNLKNICAVGDIQQFIQMNKFHLLKEFIWELYIADSEVAKFNTLNDQFESNNSLSNLQTLGIFLKSYYLHLQIPPSLTNLIRKILVCSAHSLRVFHIMGHMGIFEDLDFPVLPKVKELLLTSKPPYALSHQFLTRPLPIFPQGLCPAQVFPNLEKITIGLMTMNKIILNWDECFGHSFQNSPLVTVKYLDIQEFRDLPQGWLENLALVCPCVEEINVKTIRYNFPEDAVKGLWKFKRLKSLKLKINVWAPVNAFPAMDRVFTGFSDETCLELFNDGIGPFELESIRGLRTHASILDLKELTRLQMTFVDLTMPKKIREHPIITRVTGQYAFRMCPQLKVCIKAEGRTPEISLRLLQELELMCPFAHLHEPNNWPSEHCKIFSNGSAPSPYNSYGVMMHLPNT